MVIFMQDNPGSYPIKSFGVCFKVLILECNSHFLSTHDIFANLWYAEATFVITPFIASKLINVSVDENAFITWLIGIFSFFILILIPENLLTIYYEQTNFLIDLRSS